MKLLVVAALAMSSPRIADACSISIPEAGIAHASGDVAGRRPFIWVSDAAWKITRVAAGCKKVVCKGTPVEVERIGRLVRPKAALPVGSRLQVTRGTVVLDEVVIGKGGALPAWDGLEWISAKLEPVGKCTPAGPVVHLRIKPTKAVMTDAYLLVYTAKPDPAVIGTPATIQGLGNYPADLELRNGYEGNPFDALPKVLYVRLADGNGNVGPVIKLP